MNSLIPSTSTISSGTIGLAVAVVLAWVVNQFAGIEVPGEVQAAIGALASTIVGYFFVGGKKEDTSNADA